LKHFAAGIETFAPYLAKNEWDEDIILERSEDLFCRAQKVWPIK